MKCKKYNEAGRGGAGGNFSPPFRNEAGDGGIFLRPNPRPATRLKYMYVHNYIYNDIINYTTNYTCLLIKIIIYLY